MSWKGSLFFFFFCASEWTYATCPRDFNVFSAPPSWVRACAWSVTGGWALNARYAAAPAPAPALVSCDSFFLKLMNMTEVFFPLCLLSKIERFRHFVVPYLNNMSVWQRVLSTTVYGSVYLLPPLQYLKLALKSVTIFTPSFPIVCYKDTNI